MSASELFDIAGKKAVVTGGGSGIGTMIASGLVDAGVSVIIASRKEDSLKEVSDELAARGSGDHHPRRPRRPTGMGKSPLRYAASSVPGSRSPPTATGPSGSAPSTGGKTHGVGGGSVGTERW